jgi:arsenate reductase
MTTPDSPTTPEVLFVCVHNAGRSRTAAAVLHHHAAGRIRVPSAGSAPAEEIDLAICDLLTPETAV